MSIEAQLQDLTNAIKELTKAILGNAPKPVSAPAESKPPAPATKPAPTPAPPASAPSAALAASPTPAPVAVAPATPPAAAPTAAESPSELTEAEYGKRISKVAVNKRNEVIAVIASYGVQRATLIPKDKWPEVLEKVEAL